jgi:hypothetical protein
LIEKRVRFLLVGGHALAVHGAPRATFDIHVFVDNSARMLGRLSAALRDFGFPAYAVGAAYLRKPKRFMMLGERPLRIDILNFIDGVSFRSAWTHRVHVGEGLYTLSRADLIRNKLATGRTKDALDVELLKERCGRLLGTRLLRRKLALPREKRR